jgi:fluoroquinolone transport system permease protein
MRISALANSPSLPRFAAAFRNDLRLQFRHGFYYVYLVLAIIYVIILRVLPDSARDLLLPLVIFTDPAIAGFYFIGAIVLLERADGTQQALFITPLRLRDYFLSKVLSLSTLALATSLAIALFAVGPLFNILALIIGVALTSILFVTLGLAFVSRFKVLNFYLFSAGLAVALMSLPLLGFLNIWDSLLFWLFPTQPCLVVIAVAFRPESYPFWEYVLAMVVLLAWIIGAWLWASRWYPRYVLEWTEERP